jgi:hypothetical protein
VLPLQVGNANVSLFVDRHSTTVVVEVLRMHPVVLREQLQFVVSDHRHASASEPKFVVDSRRPTGVFHSTHTGGKRNRNAGENIKTGLQQFRLPFVL